MSNSKDDFNSSDTTNSVRPELVEGSSADGLAVVLRHFEEVFLKFDDFFKNEFKYSETNRSRVIEALLLANVFEHASLLRALTESPQRLYAPVAAIFRGIFETSVKLIWLLLDYPSDSRHKQLARNSICDDWILKKEFQKIGMLSELELSNHQIEMMEYIQKIDSEYTLNISKKDKLTLLDITKEITSYFRKSERDLYAIYRIYSGSLHGNLEALGRQYIRNDSIYLFSHDPQRFVEIYRLSSEILESIVQIFRAQAKLNPSTSSGRTDFGRTGVV